jgi:hypothetical protein
MAWRGRVAQRIGAFLSAPRPVCSPLARQLLSPKAAFQPPSVLLSSPSSFRGALPPWVSQHTVHAAAVRTYTVCSPSLVTTRASELLSKDSAVSSVASVATTRAPANRRALAIGARGSAGSAGAPRTFFRGFKAPSNFSEFLTSVGTVVVGVAALYVLFYIGSIVLSVLVGLAVVAFALSFLRRSNLGSTGLPSSAARTLSQHSRQLQSRRPWALSLPRRVRRCLPASVGQGALHRQETVTLDGRGARRRHLWQIWRARGHQGPGLGRCTRSRLQDRRPAGRSPYPAWQPLPRQPPRGLRGP